MRLQSVLVLELLAAENAAVLGLLAAQSQVGVHGRLSYVDLAAHPTRKHNGHLRIRLT